jgi:hypothetical protein
MNRAYFFFFKKKKQIQNIKFINKGISSNSVTKRAVITARTSWSEIIAGRRTCQNLEKVLP